MKVNISRLCGALLTALIAGLAGCQAKLPESTLVESIESYADSPLRAPRLLTDGKLDVPLETRTMRFRYVDKAHAGKTMLVRYEAEQGIRSTRYREGIDTAQLVRDDDGRMLMKTIDKDKHDVRTVFKPPIPVLIPDASVGETLEFEGTAHVYKRDHLDKVWSEGPYHLTVIDEGRQTLNLPAGQFQCRRYRVDYRGRFSVASVTSRTIAWYASGVGLVAEHYEESGVFLFVPWKENYTVVLEAIEE